MVYIDDAVDVMIELLNVDNEIFNIGSGQDHSIRSFAKKLCSIFDYEHDKIIYNTNRYVGVRAKRLNVDKIKSLGWEPKIGLREGIESTYKWYKDDNRVQ